MKASLHPQAGHHHDAWTNLWNKGVLHSCSSAFHGNYDGALEAFWRQQFMHLAPGSRLVDIGTGNGAIPLMAASVLRERGLSAELHGVDLADIDPPTHMAGGASRYSGIHFHPRTSALSLPFDDASVQLLTSHYAMEYMPREEVIRELVRVTSTGGMIACILHSHDSTIAKTLPSQLEALRWFFAESQLFTHARQLLKLEPGNRAADESIPAPGPTRAAFTTAMRTLIQRTQELPQADILRKITQFLRRAIEAPAGLGSAVLDAAGQRLGDEYTRLLQLQSAILTETDLLGLCTALRQAGYHVQLAPIDQVPGIRMGRTLIASRA